MTDKRDICERLDWLLSAGCCDLQMQDNEEDVVEAAKAEIERLRAIVAEAHAKPYHYMTADGKTVTAAELEAQRNAAWRALDRMGFIAPIPKAYRDEFALEHGTPMADAHALVASEQAPQEHTP